MSISKKDFFDDDFEVIYEGDLPDLPEDDDDDYEDVLQKLADYDDGDDDFDDDYDYDDDYDDDDDYDYDARRKSKKRKPAGSKKKKTRNASARSGSDRDRKKKKRRKMPNLLSPVSKTAKAGGKAAFKIANLILRAATLILIAMIFCILASNFWKNYSAYGSLATAVAEKNYALAAYAAVAVFLLLIELITFFRVLSGSKKSGRKGRYVDTGRGLLSFIFIYAGSLLSALFYGLVPTSPQPLSGVQGALLVYGSLRSTLFALCAAGVISCLIRKFAIR